MNILDYSHCGKKNIESENIELNMTVSDSGFFHISAVTICTVSEKFNNYFSQIVNSLDLYEFPSKPRREYADEIDSIVSKFKTYPTMILRTK